MSSVPVQIALSTKAGKSCSPPPCPSPPTNSQRGANEPVDIAPMAFEQAQQVMLAQMDVAQLVIIPVTAPIHILRRETLQKEALRRGCGLVKRLCGAVVGPESLWSKSKGQGHDALTHQYTVAWDTPCTQPTAPPLTGMPAMRHGRTSRVRSGWLSYHFRTRASLHWRIPSLRSRTSSAGRSSSAGLGGRGEGGGACVPC